MIVDLLRDEFQTRKRSNPRYSLRAFAGFLGLQPGRLSEYLSGKRQVTDEVAETIAVRLGMTSTLIRSKMPSHLNFIEDESFSVIADWQHFAILSLMDTKDFKNSPKWVSERLGISEFDAKESIQRLIRVGLVESIQNKLIKTKINIFTGTDRESKALKLSHTQTLQQAIEKLHDVPVHLRDITSMTMAIDPKKLPMAKKLIAEFRRKLCRYLEDGSRTEVYNLNLQLIPVTRVTEREKK